MDSKKKKLAEEILNTLTYLEMDEEQTKLVVEYEVELYKSKIDELKEHTNNDEIREYIHDWWTDYEIADETEDILLEYVGE